MNPPFCFDTANIRQKINSANFFTKKMQKIAIFSLFGVEEPSGDHFLVENHPRLPRRAGCKVESGDEKNCGGQCESCGEM